MGGGGYACHPPPPPPPHSAPPLPSFLSEHYFQACKCSLLPLESRLVAPLNSTYCIGSYLLVVPEGITKAKICTRKFGSEIDIATYVRLFTL